jgi:type I restriction enzyme R subunit
MLETMKFTEAKLEQAFIELLEIEGFPHCLGHTIARADDEVLIEEDLKNYLLNRYAKEQLTEIEAHFLSSLFQIKPSANQHIIFLLLSYRSADESVFS